MLFKLAFKNIISKKSSFVIILFISFAIMLLVVTNAVFDSTENGVKQTFVNSFTGDVVVRPITRSGLSLFGDETPVTGELTKNISLIPYKEMLETVKKNKSVDTVVSQVSGMAAVEKDGIRIPAMLFGIVGNEYVNIMPSIKIIEGTPFCVGEKGVMLTSEKAAQLNAKIGDMIQFSVADGISFRIRACPLKAIYEYEILNKTLDRIVLIDDETLRSLMDLSETISSENVILSEEQESVFSENLDDDFFTNEDTSAIFTEEKTIDKIEDTDSKNDEQSTSWNFLVIKLKNSNLTNSAIAQLNNIFQKNEWNVEAVNWRNAAGSTALYLYWMRVILNAGILIVLAAGFIVVNNTLEINVLERIKEIGTMRAIGATKRFISLECVTETLMLTLVSGFLGCVLGFFVGKIISSLNISFSNQFLIQLFGDEKFFVAISMKNVMQAFCFSGILGLLVWIYPVITALKTNPVKAMAGAN